MLTRYPKFFKHKDYLTKDELIKQSQKAQCDLNAMIPVVQDSYFNSALRSKL